MSYNAWKPNWELFDKNREAQSEPRLAARTDIASFAEGEPSDLPAEKQSPVEMDYGVGR